ncbi:hypothetical protein ACOMHN_059754 [Nucella lapillus]
MTSISSKSSSIALSCGGLITAVRESDLELLTNTSQCSSSKCSDNLCRKFKRRVQSLEASLKRGPNYLYPENMDTINLLHEHYTDPCSLPNCRVPWCRFMSYRRLRSQDNTLQELTTLLNHPMLTLLPCGMDVDQFIKLDPELNHGMVEWEDWLVISPLSLSHTVALAAPLNHSQQPAHWVVKMTALQDDVNQLCMLRKLGGLRHPHIISHIWAASSDSQQALLLICTQYLPGRSVKDVLEETQRLSYRRTRLFFLQALYAAQRLHKLNVIFLNWKCSNLLLDAREQTLKVSNFATSVDLSSDNADFGIIKLTLPADLVPAEILQNEPLSHKTDSWGLACIAHEMMTGVRPWYHLRHEDLKNIHKQILTHTPPEVSPGLPECVEILIQTCLQKPPESRLSVTEMMAHLHAELD